MGHLANVHASYEDRTTAAWNQHRRHACLTLEEGWGLAWPQNEGNFSDTTGRAVGSNSSNHTVRGVRFAVIGWAGDPVVPAGAGAPSHHHVATYPVARKAIR
jgi:hypothetical protein